MGLLILLLILILIFGGLGLAYSPWFLFGLLVVLVVYLVDRGRV